jgi:HlyD family secretion protein
VELLAEKADLLRSLSIEREAEGEEAQAGAAGARVWIVAGIAAFAALVLGGAVGWLLKPAPAPTESAASDASASGSAPDGAAVPRAGGLTASGYVVARRMATVAAEVTGRVLENRVEEGDRVRKGQVIAVLEPTLARAALQSARARAVAAEADASEAARQLGRTQTLSQQGFASDAALTAAQSHVSQAQAQAHAARSDANQAAAQLQRYEIRAPFSGVIVDKAAQAGEIISPISAGGGFTRTGICTIVDMTSLEIEVDVAEAYISRVSPGQKVEAVLDAYPDVKFPAHVIATIPAANRDRATVRVRIGFDQLDPRILPEMAIKVTLLEGQT